MIALQAPMTEDDFVFMEKCLRRTCIVRITCYHTIFMNYITDYRNHIFFRFGLLISPSYIYPAHARVCYVMIYKKNPGCDGGCDGVGYMVIRNSKS